MNRLAAIVAGLAILAPAQTWACAVCFGAKGDSQTESLNMAIITLLGTTYSLFTGMIVLAFILWRRGQKAAQALAAQEATRE
jgi:RsiW-degrading membrane proteinase PrsW (M82 family)